MKCLVTKLEEVVNNDNIEKLGVLKFYASNLVNRGISFEAVSPNTCKLKLHGVTLKLGTTVFTEEVPIPANNYYLTVISCENDGYIEIENKYGYRGMHIAYATPSFTTANLQSCDSLTSIELSKTAINGSIADLVFAGLTSLYLADTNISGDVTEFLDTLALLKNSGDVLSISVSEYCTNVPSGIGTSYATRGIVTFDGQGGYTIANP